MKNRLKKILESNKFTRQFIPFVVNKFFDDKCFESASALTYTTLLSIVPLMAVSFSIASHVPFFSEVWSDIEQFIFSNFVPSTGVEIRKYLLEFVQHAGALSLYGSIFLFFSVITMLYTVELTFNRIWGVQSNRSIIESFTLYCALLFFAPPLIAFSFVLSTYLWFVLGYFEIINTSYLLKILPLGSTWIAFSLFYLLIPNCKVVTRHALVGGFIAALLFENAKFFFTLYVSSMNSNMLIYGAFAIIPIFLFWLYISWVIVLFGAQIVCSIGFYRFAAATTDDWRFVQAYKWLFILWQAQQENKSLTILELFGKELSLTHVNPYQQLAELEHHGWIARNDKGGYNLAKDLSQLKLSDFYAAFPWRLPSPENIVNKVNNMGDDDFIINSLQLQLQQLNQLIKNNKLLSLQEEFQQHLKKLEKIQ